MQNGLIYHLFPGNWEHLTLMATRFFVENHALWNHNLATYRFVFFGTRDENKPKYEEFNLESGQIIHLPPSTRSLIGLLHGLEGDDKLVMHSAFIPKIWAVLLSQPRLWPRTAWIMFGADILKQSSIKGRIYAGIKRIVIPHLGAISALVPGEYELLKSLYGHADNYVRAFYPNLVAMAGADEKPAAESFDRPLRVLLGNSAFEANNHAEALSWLSRFVDENIEIVCPLGYPAKSEYKTQIMKLGGELLGTKFVAIPEMLESKEFWEVAGSCDLLVLNSLNQQGLGSVYFMLFHYKKIYLRSENPTFQMMKDFGIKVYNSLDLSHLSFKALVNFPEEVAQSNLDLAEEYLSLEASIRGWEDLFHRLSYKN